MSEKITLEVLERGGLGRGASRRLRRLENRVPAILYGGEKAPQNLAIEYHRIKKASENKQFYSSIVHLSVADKPEPVLVRDIQRHPASGKITHIDFQRISGLAYITLRIPLSFVGSEKSPGVKKGGIVSHVITDVELRCKPNAIPEAIEIDISTLDVGDSLHLSDLSLPAGVSMVGAHLDDPEHNLPVVSIHIPRVVEETAAPIVGAEESSEENKE